MLSLKFLDVITKISLKTFWELFLMKNHFRPRKADLICMLKSWRTFSARRFINKCTFRYCLLGFNTGKRT